MVSRSHVPGPLLRKRVSPTFPCPSPCPSLGPGSCPFRAPGASGSPGSAGDHRTEPHPVSRDLPATIPWSTPLELQERSGGPPRPVLPEITPRSPERDSPTEGGHRSPKGVTGGGGGVLPRSPVPPHPSPSSSRVDDVFLAPDPGLSRLAPVREWTPEFQERLESEPERQPGLQREDALEQPVPPAALLPKLRREREPVQDEAHLLLLHLKPVHLVRVPVAPRV